MFQKFPLPHWCAQSLSTNMQPEIRKVLIWIISTPKWFIACNVIQSHVKTHTRASISQRPLLLCMVTFSTLFSILRLSGAVERQHCGVSPGYWRPLNNERTQLLLSFKVPLMHAPNCKKQKLKTPECSQRPIDLLFT